MVQTVKFSAFATASLLESSNKLVGTGAGINIIADKITTWTTATRPGVELGVQFFIPPNGLLGYNTTTSTYEYYSTATDEWIPLGPGSSGSINLIETGTGLVGGPITIAGTISFAPIAAHSLWANITDAPNVPTEIPTSTFLLSANNLSDVPNKGAARVNLGLAIGVNVEAWSPALDSIAGLATTADKMIYTVAPDSYQTTDLTPVARSLLAQTSFSGMATVLGALPLTGGTMSGEIDMGNHKIINLVDPTNNQDAATRFFVTDTLTNYLQRSGGTMTPLATINMNGGSIVALATPINGGDATNKAYVDTLAAGLTVQPAVYAATTSALTAIYNNAASGIGATLTNSGPFAIFAIDGVNPPAGQPVLIKNQPNPIHNGAYNVTTAGDGVSVNWVLTRSTFYNQPVQITPGDLFIVNNGLQNAGTSWVETATIVAVGTDPILFSQFTFSASQVLLRANNLSDVASPSIAFNNISPANIKGDLIVDDGTNDVRFPVGTVNGQVLQVNSATSAGLAYSTATYPATTTVNEILYSSATNTVSGLPTALGSVLVTNNLGVPSMLANPLAAGRVLQSGNIAIPAWSTAAYPSIAGAIGNVLISDGTNFVSSTGGSSSATTLSDGFLLMGG